MKVRLISGSKPLKTLSAPVFLYHIHDCTQKLLLQTSLSLILIRVTGLEPIPATTGGVHPGKEIRTGLDPLTAGLHPVGGRENLLAVRHEG